MEDEKVRLMQESMKPLEQEPEKGKNIAEETLKESVAGTSTEPNENVKKREVF